MGVKAMVLRNKAIIVILLIQIIISIFIAYQVNDIKDSVAIFKEIGQLDDNQVIQPTQLTQPTTTKVNIPTDFTKDDPFKGEENAEVMIVEFSDFQCPFCSRFYTQTFSSIEENYVDTGKVKSVFKDFPLGFHQNAQKAAEAAECADEQGKFWEMHDKIFENQQTIGVDDLKQFAKDLELNTAEFDSCLDKGDMESEVKSDMVDGQKTGITGTPGFLIIADKKNADLDALKGIRDGRNLVYGESSDGSKVVFRISGALPFEKFKEVIDAELK